MNKRKVVKYSGRLCILSMATAVSLCVVGSKDANATVGGGALFSLTRMFRGIGDSVNSGVVGLKKIVSSKTSSGLKNRGLSVRPSAFGSGYKTVSLISPEGTRKVYPNQPSNPKEKLLWLGTQKFGVQKYVGSDGSEHGFIYRSNPQSESGKLSGLKLSTPQTPTPTTRTVTKIKLTSTGSPSTKSSSSGASTSTSSTTTGTSSTSSRSSVISSSSSMSSSSVTSTTSSSTSSSRGLTPSVDQSLLSLSGDKTDGYSRPGGGRKHRPGLGGYIPNFPTIEESSLE